MSREIVVRGRIGREKRRLTQFLTALAEGHSVREASVRAGARHQHFYRLKKSSEAFSELWEQAFELGTQQLEEEAVRRAMAGSDNLLMFVLKSRRPATYRDIQTGVKVEADGPVKVEVTFAAEYRFGDD